MEEPLPKYVEMFIFIKMEFISIFRAKIDTF